MVEGEIEDNMNSEDELKKILKDLDDRELRLFACWCCRQVWHLMKDERSRKAVEVAEKYAVGEVSEEELEKAWGAARGAAWDAAWDAREGAWDAWEAASVAASDAARYAVSDAAWSAASVAAKSVVEDACNLCKDISEEEVVEIVREGQVEWLRGRCGDE